MTALPLTPASANDGRLVCHYFDANRCRSCSLIETPHAQQISDKESWCREILASHAPDLWLPAAFGPDHDFRNRAKLAVGGAAGAVTLGILDHEFHGVDLRECGIQAPSIRAVIPALADFLDATGLDPYDVSARRGELKFVHVTAAPSGGLMVRFVVRSQFGLEVITARRDALLAAIPQASVVSVNLLPEHKAALEGSREVMLRGETLRMDLERVDLHLRPRSFFQTNTEVATALYDQVAHWVDEVEPRTLWDLYCGVGGFALWCAAPGAVAPRRVTGIEISEQAIESAKLSAAELGVSAEFIAGDATDFAATHLDCAATDTAPTGGSGKAGVHLGERERPDLIIVNPPRRGIGAKLSEVLENSGVEHVVYSSCNPLTLAKDLDRMPSYTVEQARVFDMFPHTKHLEVAVLLRRR
ncbi:23S rRNA (uracil(747)-C(5))-methyltransferase RlmC [Brevibacterium metallidurans]|uniref:23S rRNA (Uracil(747)-C(5))-methyltransferase RlmC n=2 Tax=Brevibacterium metallidurans TaxID=1482676 RepID=A0ABN0SKT2_9MICO